MKNKLFFGEYLIQRGLITEEDMVAALERQKKDTPAFEKLAIRLTFLTMKEVFEILTLQAESDLSFPEIAVRNGYMNTEQVLTVLNGIDEMRPTVGEILVKTKKVEKRTLAAELERFEELTRKYLDIQELLQHIQLFRHLDEHALRSLSYISEKMCYQPEERVVTEGEEADSFFAVASGFLRITKENPHGDGGEPIYIGNIGPNDVFGEASIFEEAKRTANVTADTETVLLKLRRQDFLHFIRDFPVASQGILIFIIKRLLNKLSMTNKELAYERQNFMKQQDVQSLLDELFD